MAPLPPHKAILDNVRSSALTMSYSFPLRCCSSWLVVSQVWGSAYNIQCTIAKARLNFQLPVNASLIFHRPGKILSLPCSEHLTWYLYSKAGTQKSTLKITVPSSSFGQHLLSAHNRPVTVAILRRKSYHSVPLSPCDFSYHGPVLLLGHRPRHQVTW